MLVVLTLLVVVAQVLLEITTKAAVKAAMVVQE
jgi:hypothetical protein